MIYILFQSLCTGLVALCVIGIIYLIVWGINSWMKFRNK